MQKTVFDTRNHVAGIFDKLVEMDGALGVLDVKRTSGLYPPMTVQIQTYAALLRTMGIPVDKTYLLRLDSRHKRRYELKDEDFDQAYFDDVFMPASKLADWATDFPEGPKLPEPLPSTLALPRQRVNGQPVLR